MLPVQIRILVDHLRLDPDTKLEPFCVDLLYKALKSALDLILVDIPVTESGIIVVAVAKPAVIENEHLNAEFGSLISDLQEFLISKVEIRSFPVVDQDRPSCELILAPADIVADEAVIIVRELREAV